MRYRSQGTQDMGTVCLQLGWVSRHWLVEEMKVGG